MAKTTKKNTQKGTKRKPKKRKTKERARVEVINSKPVENNNPQNQNRITRYNPREPISRQIIQKQRDAMLNVFDVHLEQLQEMLKYDAENDAANMKSAEKVWKGIDKDVQKIASKIAKQNRKTQTLSEGFYAIKAKDKTFRQRASATKDLAFLVADKVPVISQVKGYSSRVIRGKLKLHDELERQYRSATNLKDRLQTLLYGEKEGLQNLRDRIVGERNEYTRELRELKVSGEGKIKDIQEKQSKRAPLVLSLIHI